jgi:hypothetical protein
VCVSIAEKFSENVGNPTLVHEQLCHLLNIGRSAAYKKLHQGQFTLKDLTTITLKYRLDLNEIFYGAEEAQFSFQFIRTPVKDWQDYINRLNGTFEFFNPDKLAAKYFSRELPVFYYALNEHLAAFKLFAFSQKIWKLPQYTKRTFSLKRMTEEETNSIESFKKVTQRFLNTPTEELWHPDLFSITLYQLKHLTEGRFFSSYQDIEQIIDGIEETAEALEKRLDQSSTQNSHIIYAMDTAHFNNMILANDKSKKISFITFDNPNFGISQSKGLYEYLEHWFDNLKMEAYQPHGNGHFYFNQFFQKAKSQCDKMRTVTHSIYHQ